MGKQEPSGMAVFVREHSSTTNFNVDTLQRAGIQDHCLTSDTQGLRLHFIKSDFTFRISHKIKAKAKQFHKFGSDLESTMFRDSVRNLKLSNSIV